MSTLIKRWATTSGYHKGAKVEEYKYSDGSIHYEFRDKFGRPYHIQYKSEAVRIIKDYGMEDVTK